MKRYYPRSDHGGAHMQESSDGEYVRVADVEANLERIRTERLRAFWVKDSYSADGLESCFTPLCMTERINALDWVLDLGWGEE